MKSLYSTPRSGRRRTCKTFWTRKEEKSPGMPTMPPPSCKTGKTQPPTQLPKPFRQATEVRRTKTFKRHPKSKANWPRRSKPLPIISSACRRGKKWLSRGKICGRSKGTWESRSKWTNNLTKPNAWRNWPSFRRKNFSKNSKRN